MTCLLIGVLVGLAAAQFLDPQPRHYLTVGVLTGLSIVIDIVQAWGRPNPTRERDELQIREDVLEWLQGIDSPKNKE